MQLLAVLFLYPRLSSPLAVSPTAGPEQNSLTFPTFPQTRAMPCLSSTLLHYFSLLSGCENLAKGDDSIYGGCIPDICLGRHGHTRENFFWPVYIFRDLTQKIGIFDRFTQKSGVFLQI